MMTSAVVWRVIGFEDFTLLFFVCWFSVCTIACAGAGGVEVVGCAVVETGHRNNTSFSGRLTA